MSKSIIIVGVLNDAGSTNIPMAYAFQKNTYKVIPINYRSIIKNHGMLFFETLLIEIIKTNNPELVLFSKTNGIDPDLITACNKYSKTFYWFMDSYKVAERIQEIKYYAKNATFSSCTSVSSVDWLKEHGVNKCYHILEGFDTDVLKPTKVYNEYKADISFIGTKTPERDEYKKKLEDAGYNVKFYGTGYSDKLVIGKEFAKVCSSSKFMLSLNTYNNIPNYFSDRLILLTGCGTCTLHLDDTGTLNKYFEDGKEVVYFNNVDMLLEKLHSITDEDRLLIGKQGRDRTLSNYTWDHTIKKILSIINSRKKILFMCPGGQEKGKSPSELLAKKVGELSSFDIDDRSFADNIDFGKYDLLWGDMDGRYIPQIIANNAKKFNKPCYIHGEWIPPFRYETGWEDTYNEKTDLRFKGYYDQNITAMEYANLVSLGIGSNDPGSFSWIKEKTGIEFKNKFVRLPSYKKYDYIKHDRLYQVATIARVSDGKKRVDQNIKALEMLNNPPEYHLIGGNKHSDIIKIVNHGIFDNDSKVEIYSKSMLALQHWSGIPPAEAIQQFCPVITYDCKEMRDLYGDALIYVEKDNITALSETIDYYLHNEKERKDKAEKAYAILIGNNCHIRSIDDTAKLLIEKFEALCY